MAVAEVEAVPMLRPLRRPHLRWLFLIGIGLGLSRLFFIGALAFWQRLLALRSHVAPYRPFVLVIVPAHNEEKVIAQTIDNLLASTYPQF